MANMTIRKKEDRHSPVTEWRGRCANGHLVELKITTADGDRAAAAIEGSLELELAELARYRRLEAAEAMAPKRTAADLRLLLRAAFEAGCKTYSGAMLDKEMVDLNFKRWVDDGKPKGDEIGSN